MRKLKTVASGGRRTFSSTVEATERNGRALSLALALMFSIFMLPGWFDAVSRLETRAGMTLAISVGVAYTAVYVLTVPLAKAASRLVQVLACLVLLVLGWILVVVMGQDNSWVLIFALAVIAVLLPLTVSGTVTGLTLIVLGVWAMVEGNVNEQLGNFVILASITAAVALMCSVMDTNAELQRARDEIAVLAVAQERERVARDLHDILGHSLTTITLKAGVTRRILESSGDVAKATAESRDLESLSRQALADIRATVSEYRDVLLAGELAVAGATLRAAGMAADLPTTVDDVEPRLHEVFGYVLREAITNAVRHSAAGRVRVRLGPAWIEVEDDGHAGAFCQPGNGLRGLTERMRTVGGSVTAGPKPYGGFRVRAEVSADQADTETGPGTATDEDDSEPTAGGAS